MLGLHSLLVKKQYQAPIEGGRELGREEHQKLQLWIFHRSLYILRLFNGSTRARAYREERACNSHRGCSYRRRNANGYYFFPIELVQTGKPGSHIRPFRLRNLSNRQHFSLYSLSLSPVLLLMPRLRLGERLGMRRRTGVAFQCSRVYTTCIYSIDSEKWIREQEEPTDNFVFRPHR